MSANIKKLLRDTLIVRLDSETNYRVVRFHKPSTADALYASITGGVSAGIDTVYVSGATINFSALDTQGYITTSDITLELFLASNNIQGNQLEDVDRPSDVMFKDIAQAIQDWDFTVNSQPMNFRLDSLTELFFDTDVEAQQLNLTVRGVVLQ